MLKLVLQFGMTHRCGGTNLNTKLNSWVNFYTRYPLRPICYSSSVTNRSNANGIPSFQLGRIRRFGGTSLNMKLNRQDNFCTRHSLYLLQFHHLSSESDKSKQTQYHLSSKFTMQSIIKKNIAVKKEKKKAKARMKVPQLLSISEPSTRAVLAAIFGNTCVFLGKVIATIYTGSSVMAAESFHSLADIANQMLLVVGIHKSNKVADELHPYGYAALKPGYALISATGVFFLGCIASYYNAFQAMNHLPELETLTLAYAVLAGSFVVESATLFYAVRKIREMIKGTDMTIYDYITKGRDTSIVAVVCEDGAAVGGIVIAAAALTATSITANPMFDAIGAVSIGTGLGMTAIFLVKRNLTLLLGQQVEPEKESLIINTLTESDAIKSVHEVKTVTFDGQTGHFKAEVVFDGVSIATQFLKSPEGQKIITEIEMLHGGIDKIDPNLLKQILIDYGDKLIHQLALEVDALEADIQEKDDSITIIDLESHAITKKDL